MRRLATTLALLLTAGVIAVQAGVPAHAGRAIVPRSALATGHFALGVAAQPDGTGLTGWLPGTHVPFDYAYQYLAGGLDTGGGWQTWDDGGRFPVMYADAAAADGAIPVFTYYMLRQSHSRCGSCGEAQDDLAGLNSPDLMRAWYEDITTLFRRLSSYPGVSVVQVEPDLSGYANQAVLDPADHCFGYCTGTGDDPSLLRADVASSGDPDLSRLPDTFAGWAQAVRVLRDQYAPRVALGFHVSDWAPLADVGSQHDTELDPVALGTTAGRFAERAGAGAYDVVFNDVADRDAGYYSRVLGQDRWWDQDNIRFPNFHRWERYVRAVHDATGRPVWVWQIPVGNQVMRSEDDTDGHYQDNRVEYLLTHVGELTASGVTALLFGAGNPGSTVPFDGRHDGITNPAPVCSGEGSSRGSVCPSGTATVSDDDGGYLRMMAGRYYRHPWRFTPAVRTISVTPSHCPSTCTVLVRGRAPARTRLTVTSIVPGHPPRVVARLTVPATGRWSVRVRLRGAGRHVLRAGPASTSMTIGAAHH